jgi:hypothetical protein
MIIRTPLAAMSLLLLAGAAAAQSLPGPIAGGRQHQPTWQEIDNRGDAPARQWNRWAQSETGRLYDEVIRASAPRHRD